MQLRCRSCERQILAEDINIQLGIAKCQGCNSVFNFVNKLKSEPERVDRQRQPVGMPKQFQLESWGPELVLTRRWYRHAVWLLLAFCIFWDGFLVMWYSIAIKDLVAGRGGPGPWIMLAFPVLHLALGVFLTYFTLSTLVNKTVIRVTTGELIVQHGPLPWGGSRQLLTADLKQVFCTEQRHPRKRGCGRSYSVEALKRDGSKVTLVGSLEELDQAFFIEQQVEQHLKMQDEPVAGEARV
jgi:hypothetical protein